MHDESTNKNGGARRGSGLLGLGLAVVFASAAFFSGIQIGAGVGGGGGMEAGLFSFFSSRTTADEEANLDTFWRVWSLMEEKFVAGTTTDALSAEDRVFGAIEGLVKSYDDPYSVFLPPDDAVQFEENISGNFGGVGMEVGIRNDLITIIAPLKDTPAEKAGIAAGDVIVEIDGKDTGNMTIDEAVQLIRGEEGTEVALTLYREGEDDFIDVAVVRDTISIPTVETAMDGDIFIIRLYSFNALAESKVEDALHAFAESDAEKLVLDLRGNPGGFLQSAVSIASMFLPEGEVIVRESYGEGEEEDVYRSSGRVIHDFNPETMVVLVNEGSASASEILAGALAEHGIATLIGETTFGKGSVQELLPLRGGGALKVTIARWLTPEGISFTGVGVAPDIKISRTPQEFVAGEDPQEDAAKAWLHGDRNIGEETLGFRN